MNATRQNNRLRLLCSTAAVAFLSSLAPTHAQLPPVNMSKNVGQPGDNQYLPKQQAVRHPTYIDRTGTGAPVYIKTPGGGNAGTAGTMIGAAGGGAFASRPMGIDPMVLMWSNTPKVDISIEPIACDEPIAPLNFPPLPDHIQMPVQPVNNWGQPGGGSGAGGGAGGAGGWNTSNAAGGSPGVIRPIFQGVHEHYVHTAPGSYVLPQGGGGSGGGGGGYVDSGAAVPGYSGGGGGGGGIGAGLPQSQPGGMLPRHGYYKVGTEPHPGVVETFNSNSQAGGGGGAGGGPSTPPPRYTGATSKDLGKLGLPPKLDADQDKASAPDAPAAALVSQSQAQDLSLPDDEFVSRYGLKDSAPKRFAKSVGRRLGVMMYSAASGAAARAYSVIP